MDSPNDNHPALLKLRAWKTANASLELRVDGLDGGPKTLAPVWVLDVSTSELQLKWFFAAPSFTSPLVRADGLIYVSLVDSSLSPNNESEAPAAVAVCIWRGIGKHMCTLRQLDT